MTEITKIEQDWLEQQQDKALAKLCLFYARAVNLLDIKWLADSLSPDVTYTSQSVFETLKGRENVVDYLSRIFKSIRHSDKTVRAELAIDRSNKPCVAIFQACGPMDQNWLSTPFKNMTFKVNKAGKVTDFLMVTCVPSPTSVIRSGIFPGCNAKPVDGTCRIIRPSSSYEGMEVTVYVNNPMTFLDRSMMKEVKHTIEVFPGAKIRLASCGEDKEEWVRKELHELAFTGLPSLAVRWQNSVIYRHMGLIETKSLKQSLNGVFATVASENI